MEGSGKVYSFGINKFGQLGNGTTEGQANTPTVVPGKWTTNSNGEAYSSDVNNFSGFAVYRLFTGGNQSFVILKETVSVEIKKNKISFLLLARVKKNEISP